MVAILLVVSLLPIFLSISTGEIFIYDNDSSREFNVYFPSIIFLTLSTLFLVSRSIREKIFDRLVYYFPGLIALQGLSYLFIQDLNLNFFKYIIPPVIAYHFFILIRYFEVEFNRFAIFLYLLFPFIIYFLAVFSESPIYQYYVTLPFVLSLYLLSIIFISFKNLFFFYITSPSILMSLYLISDIGRRVSILDGLYVWIFLYIYSYRYFPRRFLFFFFASPFLIAFKLFNSNLYMRFMDEFISKDMRIDRLDQWSRSVDKFDSVYSFLLGFPTEYHSGAHNSFLDITLVFGVFYLISFVIFFFIVLKKIYFQFKFSRAHGLRLYLFFSCLILLNHSIFNSSLTQLYVIYPFFLFLFISFKIINNDELYFLYKNKSFRAPSN